MKWNVSDLSMLGKDQIKVTFWNPSPFEPESLCVTALYKT